MNRAVLPILLVACATPPDLLDLDDPQALGVVAGGPPSPPLRLDIDGVMENGEAMSFTVSGAPPGKPVYLAWGTAEARRPRQRTCPPSLNGRCLDVRNARLLAVPGNPVTSNAQGVATLQVVVPPTTVVPDGTDAWFQAVTLGAQGAESNVVPRFNPFDTGALATVRLIEQARVTPGTAYLGTRYEVWYSVASGHDVCAFAYDATSTGTGSQPPCPGCSFAFDVSYTAPREVSRAGDCQRLLGFDPTTLPSFSQGWGHHPSFYVNSSLGSVPVAMVYDASQTVWTWGATDVSWDAASGAFSWRGDLGLFLYY